MQRTRGGVLAIVAGAGMTLAGCADLQRAASIAPAPVDARSPVAGQVGEAARRDYPYPRFRDVPARPSDVRAATAWKDAVVGMVGTRRTVKGWVAENPALTTDTEGFAAAGRSQISTEAIKPVAGPQGESAEAFAARLRREATAPPPPR